MKSSLWITVSVITCVLAIACLIVCICLGGCSMQLQTTSGGTCYMKCYWCFRASAVLSAIMVIVYALQAALKDTAARRVASCSGCLCTISVILFNATPIIGVCGKSGMYCQTTALIVNIICAAIIILTIVALALAKPKADKPKMTL